MALYKAILAYDGTSFFGFQRQSVERTVQGTVEAALAKIGWRGTTIHAAGRTDTGVHASGQVISFEMDWVHGLPDLQNALNSTLPRDVSIRAIDEAVAGFQPRYDATARQYVYRILCDPFKDPIRERYAWRVWPAADVSSLNETAALFVGAYDFSGFGKPQTTDGPTIRRIFSAAWAQNDPYLDFTIEGNAFLFRMVRRIVFAQIEVAHGKGTITILKDYLSGKISGMVQGLAPAKGLNLVAVRYPNETGSMKIGV